MKKIVLSTCLFLFTLSVFSQTKLYLHPQAETYAKATETIAILPLRVQVNLRPKELKDFSEFEKRLETDYQRLEKLGINFRNHKKENFGE